MTTMTVAFGTSTPTSMTMVATSVSRFPSVKARMTRSLSSDGIRPCRIATRNPASGSCSSIGPRRARPGARPPAGHPARRPPRRTPRRHVMARGIRVRRSSGSPGRYRRPTGTPRTPAAPARLLPDTLPGPRQEAGPVGRGHDVVAIGERLPELGERRHLKVAVDGHRDGTRDRRGRHDQDVRPAAGRFSRSASRCSTPKRCCSSMTISPRSENRRAPRAARACRSRCRRRR